MDVRKIMEEMRAKAEQPGQSEEEKTLDALHGIYQEQRRLRVLRQRKAGDEEVLYHMVLLSRSYGKLTGNVRERLTELDGKAMEQLGELSCAVGIPGRDAFIRGLAERMAGDAAFAQVTRAANRYREKLDLQPLKPQE